MVLWRGSCVTVNYPTICLLAVTQQIPFVLELCFRTANRKKGDDERSGSRSTSKLFYYVDSRINRFESKRVTPPLLMVCLFAQLIKLQNKQTNRLINIQISWSQHSGMARAARKKCSKMFLFSHSENSGKVMKNQ